MTDSPSPSTASHAPPTAVPNDAVPNGPVSKRAKPPLSERFKALMTEYGQLAFYVYFAIFAIVIVGFALAIRLGFRSEGAAATAGTWGAAWVATKLTQPLRIAATLVLTPVIGGLLRKRKKPGSPGEPGEANRLQG